jgi:hypothetical protein
MLEIYTGRRRAMRSKLLMAALLVALCSGNTGAHAVVLNVGDSAKINFAATTTMAPFDFVDFNLMFSAANPFGTNETLSYQTFNANNVLLTSATVSSGSSVYTSGLFGQLTENAITGFNPATELTTNSFYAVITDVSGSFDLTGATADFEHIIYTTGTSQLGVSGTFVASAVPEPSTWAMLLLGFAGIGLITYRRRSTPALIAA